jgi:hypothetical protein
MPAGPASGWEARPAAVSPEALAERAEAQRWLEIFVRSRDDDLRERLILHHAPLVRYLAVRFANRGVPLEDLLQVGTIGLIRALDRYDPRHAAKFITYAVPACDLPRGYGKPMFNRSPNVGRLPPRDDRPWNLLLLVNTALRASNY